MDRLYIKSPRQKRALEALLQGSISVRNLGPAIGSLNPRQTISELRRQGFEGIIVTRRFEVVDRDGIVCHPGEYYIPDEYKPLVEKVLRQYDHQVRGRQLGEDDTDEPIISGGV